MESAGIGGGLSEVGPSVESPHFPLVCLLPDLPERVGRQGPPEGRDVWFY